jgi:hypothetical protein
MKDTPLITAGWFRFLTYSLNCAGLIVYIIYSLMFLVDMILRYCPFIGRWIWWESLFKWAGMLPVEAVVLQMVASIG